MADTPENPPRPTRLRRLADVAGVALAIPLTLGLFGQLLRDRSTPLLYLNYIPVIPLGAAAVVFDLVRRGRTVRRPRFGYATVGAMAVLVGAVPLVGLRPDRQGGAVTTTKTLTVLHWNVRWGGRGGADGWRSIRSDIVARHPDVVVLSESPKDEHIRELLADLGPGWSSVRSEHPPHNTYWWRLVVCSHWPVRLDADSAITDGRVAQVTVATDAGPLRVWVVDGVSDPRLPRTPLLTDLARLVRQANAPGQGPDIIAGDFNALGRSVGFDLLADQGYRRTSDSSFAWRGTFPSSCPLYDIDHVWVRAGVAVGESTFFTNLASDHRGQVARLNLSP